MKCLTKMKISTVFLILGTLALSSGCQKMSDEWTRSGEYHRAIREANLAKRFIYPTVVKVGDCTSTTVGAFDVVRGECAVELDNGEVIAVPAPAMVGMKIKMLNPNR